MTGLGRIFGAATAHHFRNQASDGWPDLVNGRKWKTSYSKELASRIFQRACRQHQKAEGRGLRSDLA